MDAVSEVAQAAQGPMMLVLGCGLAFLAGSVPFGLLLAKWFGHADVRRAGSGNIGATNVARVAGRRLGFVTLVLDAAKGFGPAWAARDRWHPEGLGDDALGLFAGLVGLSALLGHCFTPWLGFRGGKGVATGLGTLLALFPVVAADGLLAFAIAFAAARIVSVASLAAVVVVVLALWATGASPVQAAPMVLSLIVVVVRHKDNLQRLARRKELSL
jgi:glycerol-3-phosphate acyltransferase PlsY